MKTLKVDQVYDGYDTDTNPPRLKHKYKVTKVTNSTTPCILDHLTIDQLNVYCISEDWEVTIT